MKKNIFKFIFLIFILVLIVLAILKNLKGENSKSIISSKIFENDEEKIISNDLRIGIIEFDNINPILSNNKNVQDISRLIFDPLFTISADYKLNSALALECSKIDYNVYIIKLKQNIKWQDGNDFDSSDVIFTIDMLKNLENNSIYYYNVINISELEQIDEFTIKIILDKEIQYFEYNLIFPIVSSKYYNYENFSLESTNIKPVGTGKFYISNVENNNIILKKNTNSWEKTNIKLEAITLMLYNSLADTINAFKNDEIDLFTTSNDNIEDYLTNIQYNYKKYANRKYYYLGLNCKNEILINKEVRQAINSAINKEELAKEISNSYKISNFPLDFGNYAYSNENTIIASDKNVAKNLLIDGNWNYSNKRWRKKINYNNIKIELKIIANKDNKNTIKIANQVKSQLENIGMSISIVEANQKQYEKYISNKNYDIIVMETNYGYSPSLSKYFGDNNIFNYNSDEINTLLENAKNSSSENELQDYYTKINDIYNDEVPFISLYFNTNTFIYSKNLKGNINPNSYNIFYEIESWYREYKK